MTKINLISFFSILIGFIFLNLSYEKTKLPKLSINMQESVVNLDDRIIKILDIGQHRMISSLLWSETLLRSDIDHYKGGDFKNWMFLRVKTITELDPYFYEAYLNGGIYLSIIKDDDLGAEYIYDRGRSFYPDDYYLNLNASFHYYFELGKIEKSIEALEGAVNSPQKKDTPRFVSELLAKMKSLQGNKQDALLIISSLYEAAVPDSAIKKRYRLILYSLKAEIDLGCLNSNTNRVCQKQDLDGIDYIENADGSWTAATEWKPYKIKSPSKK